MSLTALILDDDPVMLGVLKKILDSRGYHVTAYSNPALCPHFISRTCPCNPETPCPDIIITDLVMTTVNGIQFVEEMKRKECKCKHIALISGLWTATTLQWAEKVGVKVLHKPVNLEELTNWLTDIEKTLASH